MTPAEACPCCGHRTLDELGEYELCPVCWWEDDPTQAKRPWGWGGANGISLVEAQQGYLRHGAITEEAVTHVRPPREHEARATGWQPYDAAEREVHPLFTEEEERAGRARAREHEAAFRVGLTQLRAEADRLSDHELEHRMREFSDALNMAYGDAEIELWCRLLRDASWPRTHPLQAFGWAWRHRRTTSIPARLSQLGVRPPLDDRPGQNDGPK